MKQDGISNQGVIGDIFGKDFREVRVIVRLFQDNECLGSEEVQVEFYYLVNFFGRMRGERGEGEV